MINICVSMNERDYKRRAVCNELNNKYRRAFVAKRKKEKKKPSSNPSESFATLSDGTTTRTNQDNKGPSWTAIRGASHHVALSRGQVFVILNCLITEL